MAETSLSLGGLERLSRERGVDTRPTLLRVVTDLHASAPNRTKADTERYVDLATPLLAQADHATRVAVARRLAPLPDAPDAILERLLGDDVEVACEVIRLSPRLDTERLFMIAVNGGPAEARALAERKILDPGLARVLSRHDDRQVVIALASNEHATFDAATLANLVARGRGDAHLAEVLLARPDVPARACAALYMHATPLERSRIRLALTATLAPGAPGVDPRAATLTRAAAASGDRTAFTQALAFAFRQPQHEIENLLSDPSGELLALALAACSLSREEAVSALLIFAPEKVRTSVDCIFNAAALVEDTPRAIAYAVVQASMEIAADIHSAYVPHLDPADGIKRQPAGVAAMPRSATSRQQGRGTA